MLLPSDFAISPARAKDPDGGVPLRHFKAIIKAALVALIVTLIIALIVPITKAIIKQLLCQSPASETRRSRAAAILRPCAEFSDMPPSRAQPGPRLQAGGQPFHMAGARP
jgi:hypothetical protein